MTSHFCVRLCHFSLLALGLAVFAGPAAHAAIEMKFIGIGPGSGLAVPLKYGGSAVTASVGQLHWSVQNDAGLPELSSAYADSQYDSNSAADNLVTFCMELQQLVDRQFNVYDKDSAANASNPPFSGVSVGAGRAAALDILADNFWNLATGGDLMNAVAFQLAVWEIVHESPTATGGNPLPAVLDVSTAAGSFYVNKSNPTGVLATAIGTANGWLAGISNGSLLGNSGYSIIALTNASKQDQMVRITTPSAPVTHTAPEPGALAVWGLLGAAAVVVARCRRSH